MESANEAIILTEKNKKFKNKILRRVNGSLNDQERVLDLVERFLAMIHIQREKESSLISSFNVSETLRTKRKRIEWRNEKVGREWEEKEKKEKAKKEKKRTKEKKEKTKKKKRRRRKEKEKEIRKKRRRKKENM